MYRNRALRTLNRTLFSAILQALFAKARAKRIDPYTTSGILTVQQLVELINAVNDSYSAFLLDSGYPKPGQPSDILISKILMGVMGVLPAFDTCFKTAIPTFNSLVPEVYRLSDKLNDVSLMALLKVVQDANVQNYLSARFDGLIKVGEKVGNGDCVDTVIQCPPMRLLDLLFWVYGLKFLKK